MSELPFKYRLYNALQDKKLSQMELAHSIDVSPATVSAWIVGKAKPTSKAVEKLSAFLNIDFGEKKEEGNMLKRRAKIPEETIELMKQYRMDGYTNKQIAEMVGVGVASVYDHIGKRSMDVRKAGEQNKPIPRTSVEQPEFVIESADDVRERIREEMKEMGEVVHMNNTMNGSGLSLLAVHEIMELQGGVCVYKIDSDSECVELLDKNGGQLTGIIDYASIPQLITELQYIMQKHERKAV